MLSLRDVVKDYGDFTAVNNLNLEVEAGRVFGVLGPNGAGKTTTMRMITGLLEPTSGTIEIGEYDLESEPEKAKSITSFIPDSPFIYDKLTAGEYMDLVGGLYEQRADVIAERSEELLALFDLQGWENELIESFSHGMKQRLVFAGALLPDPELLVIDEPMVGLDPQGHQTVKQLFTSLAHEEDKTILLSTHTLGVAEEVCDELVIINEGDIIARGTLDELSLEAGSEEKRLEEVFLKLTERANSEAAE